MKTKFATTWNASTQVRKQRKYRFNAPLHVKQNFVHVHLSVELRTKHGKRNVQVKKGDKVKVLRGSFKQLEGKVDRVDLKQEKIYIQGIENSKKDGSKVMVPFRASNLMITALDLSDKKRKKKLENEKSSEKNSNA